MFRDYLDLYRDAVRATKYVELPDMQPEPFATLGRGGAGTAYALWRLGEKRRAKVWAKAAVADRRKRAVEQEIMKDDRRASIVFGPSGARWAMALIAPDQSAGYARALRDVPLDEVVCGAAGHVLAARALPTPPAVVAKLSARVVANVRTRIATPWTAADAGRFAHHWPGQLYTALVVAPDADLIAATERMAALWTPEDVAAGFGGSWCNGAAGMLLLFARALELGGDLRAAATKAAEVAIAHRGMMMGLCCGDIGIAYALLALARVDGNPAWIAQAREAAAHEIGRALYHHPNGLYYGHPGLVSLALDLVEAPHGFPTIEAISSP